MYVAPPFIPECIITTNCLAHGNEGEATPTTAWMIEGAPRFLHGVLFNFSIQSRIGVVFHFEHSISKIKSQNKVVFKLGCIQL